MVVVLLAHAPACHLFEAVARPGSPWPERGIEWIGCDGWLMASSCGTSSQGDDLTQLKKALFGAIGTAPNTGTGLVADKFWAAYDAQKSQPTPPSMSFTGVGPTVLAEYDAWKAGLSSESHDWRSATAADTLVFIATALNDMILEQQSLAGHTVRPRVVHAATVATGGCCVGAAASARYPSRCPPPSWPRVTS